MIRHQRGSDVLLIPQHDHAVAAGLLAAHVGNDRFAPPSPYLQTVDAIALHDSGWPLHDDDAPTLNGKGLPLHVLETPPRLASVVWSESVRRASARDPYSGLLVSLHVMRLSRLSQLLRAQRANPDPRELFEINQFQHAQVEVQEALRTTLGMRTDAPLDFGLAAPGRSEDEDQLRFNFGLLKLLDAISLDGCCSEPVFKSVDAVHPRPGAAPLTLTFGHPAPFEITVDPWPFDRPALEVEVPYRVLPATPFADEAAFRAAYAAAPTEAGALRVHAP